MSKTTQTRYAVVSKSTMKSLKNAETRQEARNWKAASGKTGLRILDRESNTLIS